MGQGENEGARTVQNFDYLSLAVDDESRDGKVKVLDSTLFIIEIVIVKERTRLASN